MYYFCARKSLGRMVEWSITPVSKTGVLRGTGGSNPSPSAIALDLQALTNNVHEFVHKTPGFNTFPGVFYAHF